MSAPLRYTTARKTYRCARCGRVIPRGELHVVASRQHKGEHYLLFTPAEAEKFRPRLFGIEAELAGEIDLEFQTVGNVPSVVRGERSLTAHPSQRAPHPTMTAPHAPSEVDIALANPAVRKLIAEAEARIGVKSRGYVEKAIRVSWDSPVTLEELRAGKALGPEGLKRYRAGFREAQKIGLVADVVDPTLRSGVGGGRFLADRAKIKKLIELSGRFAKRLQFKSTMRGGAVPSAAS